MHTLEQERSEYIAEAYATRSEDFLDSTIHDDDEPQFDQLGRQLRFVESVRQRQSRLEYIRRQEYARRLALKGLNDTDALSYVIVSDLSSPRFRVFLHQ